MPAGRPKGSRNRFPMQSKIRDELLGHNFDWMKEFSKLYFSSPSDVQCDLLLGVAPYLFPKRKPEDATGDASEVSPVSVQITDEQLGTLIDKARGE